MRVKQKVRREGGGGREGGVEVEKWYEQLATSVKSCCDIGGSVWVVVLVMSQSTYPV